MESEKRMLRAGGIALPHVCRISKAEAKSGKNKKMFVYLLTSWSPANGQRPLPKSGPITYVGCTNNIHKRLRQHNGKEKGGSFYTRRRAVAGTWAIRGLVTGFCCRHASLVFEKKWKLRNRAFWKETQRGNTVQQKLAEAVRLAYIFTTSISGCSLRVRSITPTKTIYLC